MLTGNFQSEMNYFEPSQAGREGNKAEGEEGGGTLRLGTPQCQV